MENKYSQRIFYRFVNFINKIFGKKVEQEVLGSSEISEKKEAKSDFFDEIRIYNEENKELLDLQRKYENKEVSLGMMSNEEIHELNLLYKRQVSDLMEKLNDKKAQLAVMKNKIEVYSENI